MITRPPVRSSLVLERIMLIYIGIDSTCASLVRKQLAWIPANQCRFDTDSLESDCTVGRIGLADGLY